MALTGKLYTQIWKSALQKRIDIENDAIKLALFTSSLTINQDTHQFFDAAPYTSNQVTGTNYTAGGVAITPGSIAVDGATHKVTVDFADAVWSDITIASPGARYGIVYDSTPASNKPLIGYVDLGGDQQPTNGNMSLAWNASGVFYATVS